MKNLSVSDWLYSSGVVALATGFWLDGARLSGFLYTIGIALLVRAICQILRS